MLPKVSKPLKKMQNSIYTFVGYFFEKFRILKKKQGEIRSKIAEKNAKERNQHTYHIVE